MTVIGIGVDLVHISRVGAALRRTPKLAERIFAPVEMVQTLSAQSVAARFAAKEAIIKAVGGPAGLALIDCQILTDTVGRPHVHPGPSLRKKAAELGITGWQVSLSHDAGMAIAFVIATGDAP